MSQYVITDGSRYIYKNHSNKAVLNVILEKRISETVADEIRSVIEAMDRRTYEPRKLTELFDL